MIVVLFVRHFVLRQTLALRDLFFLYLQNNLFLFFLKFYKNTRVRNKMKSMRSFVAMGYICKNEIEKNTGKKKLREDLHDIGIMSLKLHHD